MNHRHTCGPIAMVILLAAWWLGQENSPVHHPENALAPKLNLGFSVESAMPEGQGSSGQALREPVVDPIKDAINFGRSVESIEYTALSFLDLHSPYDPHLVIARLLPLTSVNFPGLIAAVAYYRWIPAEDRFVMTAFSRTEAQGWKTFPPLSAEEGTKFLRLKQQSSLTSTLYALEGDRPYYGSRTAHTVVFVDAIDGEVVELDNEAAPLEASKFIAELDQDGLIKVTNHQFSGIELERFEWEVAETNAAISAGLLKLGPDLQVVFDYRVEIPCFH